jgi:hypothetical protein
MLALNDYIPEWSEPPRGLSETERLLGITFFSSIFNHTSDDPLRFVVRTVEIFGGDVRGGPIGCTDWEKIQLEAFGCSFGEYAEYFLIPIFMMSLGWGARKPPLLAPRVWEKTELGHLYRRWFGEASIPINEAHTWADPGQLASGLPRFPGAFFRTPLVANGDGLICLSPWHWRDQVSLATWSKLNRASKKVLGAGANQRFTSTFGYLFERWCASVMRNAATEEGFRGKVLIPSSTGAHDEVEDVVLIDGDRVVLFSAKSSLVPEASLKASNNLGASIAWLRRFFFDEVRAAKKDGFRAGALHLLDARIQRIRAGDYEDRGIRKDMLILPVIVPFDNVGESGPLYQWIESNCLRLGILSARPRVRP